MNHGQGGWGPIRDRVVGFRLFTTIASRNGCELTVLDGSDCGDKHSRSVTVTTRLLSSAVVYNVWSFKLTYTHTHTRARTPAQLLV
jgi:hypothetical protein